MTIPTANYAQNFRHAQRGYIATVPGFDMVRRPAVTSLRSAFRKGEQGEGENRVPEPPAGRNVLKKAGTSWYDDSVSEPAVEEPGPVFELEGDQPAFELEGDSPLSRHVLHTAASAPYGNMIFELETIEVARSPDSRASRSLSRGLSYPQLDRDNGHHPRKLEATNTSPAIEEPEWKPEPYDEEQFQIEHAQNTAELYRYWFESADYPEWTILDPASNHENVSQLVRIEYRLRRSLSITQRWGNEMLERVRPRSASVASFFQSTLTAQGGGSLLVPAIRRIALHKGRAVALARALKNK